MTSFGNHIERAKWSRFSITPVFSDIEVLGKSIPVLSVSIYYPKRFQFPEISSDSIIWREQIWRFKNGEWSESDLISLASTITHTVRSLLCVKKQVYFVPVPASTQAKSNSRYDRLCGVIGTEDNCVKDGNCLIWRNSDVQASHLSHDRSSNGKGLMFNEEILRGAEIVLFDDVLTTGRTLQNIIRDLQRIGCHVRLIITLGKTSWPNKSIASAVPVEEWKGKYFGKSMATADKTPRRNWSASRVEVVEWNGHNKSIENNEKMVRWGETELDDQEVAASPATVQEIVMENGVYRGESLNGRAHGEGELSLWSGEALRGLFEDGEVIGRADLFRDNQLCYSGHFQSFLRHGRGKSSEGHMEYIGDWEFGKKNGFGIAVFRNGDRYQGEWLADKMHGYGKLEFIDGGFYEGGWRNNRRHGEGKLAAANGMQTWVRYFEGAFIFGEL